MEKLPINLSISSKTLDIILNYKKIFEKDNNIDDLDNEDFIRLLHEFLPILESQAIKSFIEQALLKDKKYILKEVDLNGITENGYKKLVEEFINHASLPSLRLKLQILLNGLNRRSIVEQINNDKNLEEAINVLTRNITGTKNGSSSMNSFNKFFKEESINPSKINLKKTVNSNKNFITIVLILFGLFISFGCGKGDTSNSDIKQLTNRQNLTKLAYAENPQTLEILDILDKKSEDEIISILKKAISEKDSKIKKIAILRLGNMEKGAKKAIPILLNLLEGGNYVDRWNAARAIGMIGNKDPEVIDTLTKALLDEIPRVVISSALALGIMGSSAKSALPVLKKKMDDKNVSFIIEEVIGCIENPNQEKICQIKQKLSKEESSPFSDPNDEPRIIFRGACMCSSE